MKYYLGIDIGTHESKGTVIREDGQILAVRTLAHGVDNPAPGWFSQDADRIWWGDFCALSRDLPEAAGIQARDIACVGLSALGCDCVPVDREGCALAPSILYGVDARAKAEIDFVKEYYGAEEAAQLFGHEPCSSDVAPKILWFKNNMPEVWQQADKFLTASSYLCVRLTGRFVLDPYLAEDFRPLYRLDPDNAGIDEEHTGLYCRPDQLADLMPATKIAGTITHKASLETGLPEGVPVLAGTGDSGAEAISSGLCRPGDLMIQLGSSAYMICLSDHMIEEPRLWPGTFIIPGTCGICAGTNTAGALTEWIRKNFYQSRGRETDGPCTAGEDTSRTFAEMEAEASWIPAGSDGLICLPYWAGERTPINDPEACGMYFGLNTTHTRGHMVRSALEGICFTIRANVELMKQHGLPIRRVLAVGGGTRNKVWLQCLADILGDEILVPEITLGAAYGDALMAALAQEAKEMGEEAAWSRLADKIRMKEIITPCRDNQQIYDKNYAVFTALYEANKELMHTLH